MAKKKRRKANLAPKRRTKSAKSSPQPEEPKAKSTEKNEQKSEDILVAYRTRDKVLVHLGVNINWLGQVDDATLRLRLLRFLKVENVSIHIGGLSVYVGWSESKSKWTLRITYNTDINSPQTEIFYKEEEIEVVVGHWIHYTRYYEREWYKTLEAELTDTTHGKEKGKEVCAEESA